MQGNRRDQETKKSTTRRASAEWARRIRTADLLGAIRGGQSYAVQEIADLQAVSLRSMGPSTSGPPAIYARICGDVIRVGNFWREEIEKAGSKGDSRELGGAH
jgi:hypothetical protein